MTKLTKILIVLCVLIAAVSSFASDICPKDDLWTTTDGYGYIQTDVELQPGVNLSIFYRVLTTGDASAKADVYFLIPGGPGMSVRDYDFSSWLERLPKGSVAFAVEPRGVGCSRPAGLVEFPADMLGLGKDAADIEKVRFRLFGEDRRVFLWGKGYGALVALDYSAQFSKSAKRIIMESPLSTEAFKPGKKLADNLMREFFKNNSGFKARYNKKLWTIKGDRKDMLRVWYREYILAKIIAGEPADTIAAAFENEFDTEAETLPKKKICDSCQLDVFMNIFCKAIYPADLIDGGKRDIFGRGNLCAPYKGFGRIKRYSVMDGLMNSRKKVLIMAGERDVNFPPEFVKKISEETIPDRVFPVIVPNAGLNIFNENNRCSSALIKSFLNNASVDDIERIIAGSNCEK